MHTIEHRREGGQGLLDRVKILSRREGGVLEAYVPISLVYTQDVPFDITHVEELARSIQKESETGTPGTNTGQLTPVLLGEVPGLGQFPIIDGFHRVPALKSLGREEVFATVRQNSTWEEIADLRILSASTHKAVRFSRLIEWIEESWKFSPWSGKMQPIQAFQLQASKQMTGVRSGLSSEEVDKIREWVSDKCEKWRVAPDLIYKDLAIARVAAPDLVKKAREGRSGRTLEAITPQHLQVISAVLPHRYDLQRVVAKASEELSLSVARARTLAAYVASAQSEEEASEIIQSGRWKELGVTYTRERKGSPRGEVRFVIAKEVKDHQRLIDEFYEDEINIALLTIEIAKLTGRYLPQEIAGKHKFVLVTSNEQAILPIGLDDSQTDFIVGHAYGMRSRVQGKLRSRFGVSPEDGEDIFSEVIYKTLKAIKEGRFEYKGEDSLEAWIMTLARNEVISRNRKEKGSPSAYQSYGDGSVNPIDNIEDERANKAFEQTDIGDEYKELVRSSLPHIPKEQRRIFVLRHYFDLPFYDIALVTGKTPNNAKVHYFRAKEKITRLIDESRIT